ncbi:MAG TPA: DoxX family protein [Thermoleophilaceae bacterium]
METVLWIIQIALALVFGATGLLKLTRSRQALASKMTWVEETTDAKVKAVGALEVLAAIGLILPAALGIVPQLTALAAVGVVLLMAGAMKTHGDMDEWERVPLTVVLALLALFVAVQRFGPHAL